MTDRISNMQFYVETNFVGLEKQSTETIKNALGSYIGQKGFIGTIKWLAFHIASAVLGIFRANAWQKCEKILADFIIRQVTSNSSLPALTKQSVEKCAHLVAEHFFLKKAYKGVIDLPESVTMEHVKTINNVIRKVIDVPAMENIQRNTLKSLMSYASVSDFRHLIKPDDYLQTAMDRSCLKGVGIAFQEGVGTDILLNLISYAFKEFMARSFEQNVALSFFGRSIQLTAEQLGMVKEVIKELSEGKMNPNLTSDAIQAVFPVAEVEQIEFVRKLIPQLAAGEFPEVVKDLLKKYNQQISSTIFAGAVVSLLSQHIPKELKFLLDLDVLKHGTLLNSLRIQATFNPIPNWHKNRVTVVEFIEGILNDLTLDILLKHKVIPDQFLPFATQERFDALKECIKSVIRWQFPQTLHIKQLLPNAQLERIGKIFVDMAEGKPISLSQSLPELPQDIRDEVVERYNSLPGKLMRASEPRLNRLNIQVIN